MSSEWSIGSNEVAWSSVNDLFTDAYESLTSRRQAIVRSANESEAERKEVADIDAALGRLAKGSYGHCERCGHAIGRQRLRAVPEARFCRGCTDELAELAEH